MSEFSSLIQDIEGLEGCARTKRRVLNCLYARASRQLYVSKWDLLNLERRKVARSLLDSGMSRAEAARALSARAGISLRSAQRWVARVAQ